MQTRTYVLQEEEGAPTVGGEAQEPEHGVWDAGEDGAPGGEGLRVILVQLIGAGIHNLVVRQPNL